MIAVLAVSGAAITAPEAVAFVGEDHVINPSTGRLTDPAETLLTKPTFLEEFEDAAPAGKKSSLFRGLMGSRALPMIGRILPVIGGAFVAYEVCNAIFDGCLTYTSEDASPPPAPSGGSWVWTNRPVEDCSSGCFQSSPMIYYWSQGWNAYIGYGGLEEKCEVGAAEPSGTTAMEAGGPTKIKCWGKPGFPIETVDMVLPVRTASSQQVHYGTISGSSSYTGSDYCRAWGPTESPACRSEPDAANWQKQMADYLKEKADPEVGQYVASEIEGTGVKNPWAAFVTVPDCGAYLWGKCAEELEDRELEPVRKELDWETAVVEKPADAVVETDPAGGAEVVTGSKVTVTTNPDDAGMPLVIPQPEHGETYSEYITRLAPGLNPERVNLPIEYTDTSVGPNAVVAVQPEPDTRLDPSTSHNVEVQTNSPLAPPPAGGWAAPGLPDLDLTPLMAMGLGCDVFPFGAFCWLGEAVETVAVAPQCPQFDIPIWESEEIPLDACVAEPMMVIVRPVILFVATIGLGIWFAMVAMKSGDRDGD